jgi:hypothetical protein
MLTIPIALLVAVGDARAQSEDAPKVEVGVQFSSLTLFPPRSFGDVTEPGFGGRLTYNLTDNIAVEAEGNFFPHKNFLGEVSGGRMLQGQFGVKAGKRFEKWGIYGKVRPGVVSFGETVRYELEPQTSFIFVRAERERKTHFSTDVGGVLEFYPSRRIVARFDAGDTIIRYGEHQTIEPFTIPGQPVLVTARAETKHNFQFSAGVGYRFGDDSHDNDGTQSNAGVGDNNGDVPRFEIGAQFTSLSFNQPSSIFTSLTAPRGLVTEPGFGARFTVNLNRHVALEAEGNYFTRNNFSSSPPPSGHAYQGQFGIKAGKRFDKWGVFAKARPGFVGFTKVLEVSGIQTIEFEGQQFSFPTFSTNRKEYFSTDVGGVLEFYPSRRIVARFDAGDTIIRYGEREGVGIFAASPPIRVPSETKHNFQFSAGIGLRF